MKPIRRWPRPSRYWVARRPPAQLVAPIVGALLGGDPGGIDDDHR